MMFGRFRWVTGLGMGVDDAQRPERARFARRFRHLGNGTVLFHHPLTERIRIADGVVDRPRVERAACGGVGRNGAASALGRVGGEQEACMGVNCERRLFGFVT